MTTSTPSKVNFEEFWFDLRSGKKRLDDFPEDAVTRAMELSSLGRLELQAFFDRGVRLELSSPKAGDRAPDFRLESIDRQGNRTGKLIQLSETLEKPLALVFGSYT